MVEAALLLEAGWNDLVDEIWVLTAPEVQVVERVQARSHLDRDGVVARIRAQMPESERVSRADAIIDNSGSLTDLRSQVETLWRQRVLQARKLHP